MPPLDLGADPRNFFLNEGHELSAVDKGGGGRIPEYVGISWAQKAQRISASLGTVLKEARASRDPLRDEQYFVLAEPVASVRKKSVDKQRAPDGSFSEPTAFGDIHGRVFDRLGLDLIQVTDDGKAVVHGDRERVDQLLQRAGALESLGAREQSRWVTIDAFETIPLQLRVDTDWLRTLKPQVTSDVVIELQPVLNRVDADRVLRAIADMLQSDHDGQLTGSGTDFSGRYWFRGKAAHRSVRAIARDFYSVQSIHSPLYSVAARSGGRGRDHRASIASRPPADSRTLPCVAIVDLGVATDHLQLAPYRRGQFVPQDAPAAPVGDHGASVASRVVFGECASATALAQATGRCAYYDATVADYPGIGGVNRVNDKIVLDALRGVRGAAPDVRVFNLSFGDARPIEAFATVVQREKRLLLQDLDNFAFATDSVIVVAAGNSALGVVPTSPYPANYLDSQWGLGPWACGFNTLVCGAYVGRVTAAGLVRTVGWPSPFSRVGPGLCGSPVPSFGAEGGNADSAYRYQPGLGVWVFSGSGMAEDQPGTSFAAPLLAREAALALSDLQMYCAPGTRPFAVTVRAFLAATARRPAVPPEVAELARRTLGFGQASALRIAHPECGSALILWQGFIENQKDLIRVQLPIPRSWLAEADDPVLRIVVCYDPPVNETARAVWACRKVRPIIRPGPEERALRSPSGSHETYPMIDREYSLAKYAPGAEKETEHDLWLVELSYDEIYGYPPGMDFDSRQRVAFVAELFDRGANPVDPQPAMQALPIAPMNRLSVQPAAVRTPLLVRTRGGQR